MYIWFSWSSILLCILYRSIERCTQSFVHSTCRLLQRCELYRVTWDGSEWDTTGDRRTHTRLPTQLREQGILPFLDRVSALPQPGFVCLSLVSVSRFENNNSLFVEWKEKDVDGYFYIYTYIHAYVHAYVQACAQAYVHTYTYTCVCVCVYWVYKLIQCLYTYISKSFLRECCFVIESFMWLIRVTIFSFSILVQNLFFIVNNLGKLIKDKGTKLICTPNIYIYI